MILFLSLAMMKAENSLPGLQELSAWVESPHAILEFLESRWAVGGLQSGVISIYHETHMEDRGGVKRLKDATMKWGTSTRVEIF